MKKNKLFWIPLLLFIGGCTNTPISTSDSTSNITDTTITSSSSDTTVDIEPPKPEIYEYSSTPYVYQNVYDYYAPIEGLVGWRLKSELYKIVRGHTKVSYNNPSGISYQEFYGEIDADILDNENINLLYSGSCHKNTPFDREHIWPKSLGLGGSNYDKYLTGVDIHNLRPALSSINSTRGNMEWDKNGTSTNDNLLGNKYGDKFFEPIDAYKGEVARAIFYMATRYEGYEKIDGVLSETSDLELVEMIGNTYNTGEKNAYIGNVKTLLEWHKQDPVDKAEVHRNELIYTKYQHNRNPFVDHPEFADMIFDSNYAGVSASASNPESQKTNLPLSHNSGIGSCINGNLNTEIFLKNASGVTTGYSGNVNKTFMVGSNSLTMSAGLKSGYSFTLGTNGTASPVDVLPTKFDKSGTTIKSNASSLILNSDLSNIDGFKIRYANPALNSINSYYLFRSIDGGMTFKVVESWTGFDVTLQKGVTFTAAESARFAIVIAGSNPRLSIVSLSFYQNGALK